MAVSALREKEKKRFTYINSYFMLEGGFFLVERWISDESFVLNRTLTSAENTERIILVSEVSSRSVGITGVGRGVLCFCGVEEPVRDPSNEEKNPVATALTGFGLRRFRASVPNV